jgi:hypothetical protein
MAYSVQAKAADFVAARDLGDCIYHDWSYLPGVRLPD